MQWTFPQPLMEMEMEMEMVKVLKKKKKARVNQTCVEKQLWLDWTIKLVLRSQSSFSDRSSQDWMLKGNIHVMQPPSNTRCNLPGISPICHSYTGWYRVVLLDQRGIVPNFSVYNIEMFSFLVGPPILIFRTSADVCLGSKCQGREPLVCVFHSATPAILLSGNIAGQSV